jgi:hypothetical protein
MPLSTERPIAVRKLQEDLTIADVNTLAAVDASDHYVDILADHEFDPIVDLLLALYIARCVPLDGSRSHIAHVAEPATYS